MATSIESTREHTCPCGNGTYAVALSANDWGRSTEQWTMRCGECRCRYVLLDYTLREKDRQWLAQVWVLASDRLSLGTLDEEITDAEASIEQRARLTLLDEWMSLPSTVGSRKRLWELMTDSGEIEYPSLSTFYAQVRRIGLDRYWEQEFSPRNMSRILVVLEHDDHELRSALDQLGKLKAKRVEMENRLISEGFA